MCPMMYSSITCIRAREIERCVTVCGVFHRCKKMATRESTVCVSVCVRKSNKKDQKIESDMH